MRVEGNLSKDFDLLYPPSAGSDRQNVFLELSSAVAHDLGVDDIITSIVIWLERTGWL